MSRNFFCMISKGDVPLYEVHLSPPPPHSARPSGKDELVQFILHASLDSVDAKLWQTSSMYLRNVDRFNDLMISALITPGHLRLLLLHDQRTDEALLRAFFFDAYELYVRLTLNPFYDRSSVITSRAFDERIRALGDKYLNR